MSICRRIRNSSLFFKVFILKMMKGKKGRHRYKQYLELVRICARETQKRDIFLKEEGIVAKK